jgi:cellulose synthase (UDP-forming)
LTLNNSKSIYILDDGDRDEIKALADKYNVQYLRRDENTNYKAGNLNNALKNSFGEFILVLDADQIVNPNIAKDLLGHFIHDPKLAIVTTKQHFDVPKNDFNHQRMFYEYMQPGKNSDNAAFSCGSGVFYRRSALEEVGGFQTWNIVEDVYTTYVMHSTGYKSLYINKSYTTGLAPTDLPTIYKQRGTWALDTLRIFLKKNPLLQKGLSFKQRLHYFEICIVYLFPALAIPILFTIMPLSIVMERDIVTPSIWYPILRFPSLLLTLIFFYKQSGNRWIEIQFWISLFPK